MNRRLMIESIQQQQKNKNKFANTNTTTIICAPTITQSYSLPIYNLVSSFSTFFFLHLAVCEII